MFRKRRGRRSWGRKVYTFRRVVTTQAAFSQTIPNYPTSTSNTAPYATFRLSDLPSASEFTSLYDQYMISKVVVRLTPRGNVQSISDNQGGFLCSVIDYTDTAPIVSITEMNQYSTLKKTRSHRPHVRVIRPMYLAAGFQQEGGLIASVPRRGWIRCENPDVRNGGIS